MKNEVVVQSHTVSLKNFQNQIGKNRHQGNLLNNTDDLRREGKEHCKVINLRFGKDIHSPVGVPKRRAKSTSI